MACLILKDLFYNAPTSFYSKKQLLDLCSSINTLLKSVFHVLHNPQPIVPACAANALFNCLCILIKRRHPSTMGRSVRCIGKQ